MKLIEKSKRYKKFNLRLTGEIRKIQSFLEPDSIKLSTNDALV